MVSIIEWLEERRLASRLRVRQVDLDRCRDWSLSDGELRHSSGRYFQVVGARVSAGTYAGWCRPMIRQHEIGTLGFMVTEQDERVEWLVQAKTEPGNVGGTQLAPTVQATASNQDRVHGGSPTRFLEWFRDDPGGASDARVRSDILASEQGARFLGKRNRNVIVSIDPSSAPPSDGAWRWVDRSLLRRSLTRDFIVNTDARSVISTGPWSLISEASQPFSAAPARGGFRGALRSSYETPRDIAPVLRELTERRSIARPLVEESPMRWSGRWFIDGGREPVDDTLTLVEVDVADREVAKWHQPLLTNARTERCDLYAQRQDGVMRFLFQFSAEPGARNLVELAPTAWTDQGVRYGAPPSDAGRTRLSVLQSDEGSRFLDCVVRYRIMEIEPGTVIDSDDGVWLCLSEIEALASLSGVFTNEARSAISLLLSLA